MKTDNNGNIVFKGDWYDAANWLDKVAPGWYSLVDVERLSNDIDNQHHILNQVFGSHLCGKPGYFINGFYRAIQTYRIDGTDRVWNVHQNNWRGHINQRKRYSSKTINNLNGNLWDANRLDLTIHPDGTVTGRLI